MDKKIGKEVLDWVLHIVIAVLLAVLIIIFLGRLTIVEGNSMSPTLHNHDIIIIESVTSRFGGLKQGDIVVMRIPELLENRKKYAVKRVIATENQHVEVKEGKVFVDGNPLTEEYVQDIPTLPGNEIYDDIIVPEGCIYVLGDNRLPEKSRDSRIFGPVNKNRVIGKFLVRIFPFSRIGSID